MSVYLCETCAHRRGTTTKELNEQQKSFIPYEYDTICKAAGHEIGEVWK